MAHKLLVVGGSGFVGSAICRAALSRGWEVVSVSSRGEPYRNAKGHEPAWTSKVEWRAGSAFDPASFSGILPECTAAVHTIGILLESDYKKGGPAGVLGGVAKGLGFGDLFRGGRNPLEKKPPRHMTYEGMNRDSALNVFEAFASSSSTRSASALSSPFVYVSAEDIFRPIIPSRYISTKREAEQEIMRRVREAEMFSDAEDLQGPSPGTSKKRQIRPVFVRPSLIYHPHQRPSTTLPATLVDLSSTIQRNLPPSIRAQTLSGLLTVLTSSSSSEISNLPSPLQSLANLLSIPPVHVDWVGEAICRSIEREDVRGVVGVEDMKRMLEGPREDPVPVQEQTMPSS